MRRKLEDYAKGVLIKKDNTFYQAVMLGDGSQQILRLVEEKQGLSLADIASLTCRSKEAVRINLNNMLDNKIIRRFKPDIPRAIYRYYPAKYTFVDFEKNNDNK